MLAPAIVVLGWVLKVRLVAGPELILNAVLVAPVSPLLEAVSV
jgi:hypothetical protein